MTITQIFALALGAILVENFVLVRFLGICPFLGVSKRMDTSVGMGLSVIFVMGVASAATYGINVYLLQRFDLEYLQTVAYVLTIAVLVHVLEMFLQKAVPALYRALGIYLPLISTNCAVLGVAILNTQSELNLLGSVVYGVSAGIGFTLAIVLFASVRERLEFAEIPPSFEGFPIALITAALLAMSFMGFQGLQVF